VLAHSGSKDSLTPLAKAAKEDRTTLMMMGDVGGQSSARRAATFAIAELASRFPDIKDQAAGKLRALTVVDDPKDGESLADARDQSLYQLTRDPALLKPFLDRLKNPDPKTRERGVVAFQFLNLKQAPPELRATLKDADKDIRSWAALVLGTIGDPGAAAPLLAAAADPNEDLSVRCNAIYALGRMKCPDAASPMEKLLADPNPGIQSNAAIALYRITGKKTAQFPEGYNAD
jgi:HEAT repeat protein